MQEEETVPSSFERKTFFEKDVHSKKRKLKENSDFLEIKKYFGRKKQQSQETKGNFKKIWKIKGQFWEIKGQFLTILGIKGHIWEVKENIDLRTRALVS